MTPFNRHKKVAEMEEFQQSHSQLLLLGTNEEVKSEISGVKGVTRQQIDEQGTYMSFSFFLIGLWGIILCSHISSLIIL